MMENLKELHGMNNTQKLFTPTTIYNSDLGCFHVQANQKNVF